MQSHIMPCGHVSSLVPFLGRHSLTSLGAFIGSTRVYSGRHSHGKISEVCTFCRPLTLARPRCLLFDQRSPPVEQGNRRQRVSTHSILVNVYVCRQSQC